MGGPIPGGRLMVLPFTTEVLNLDAWRNNVRAVTPEYVPFAGWANFAESIRKHATGAIVDPCLSVEGEAGVGKTRLVFESLADIRGIESLVLRHS